MKPFEAYTESFHRIKSATGALWSFGEEIQTLYFDFNNIINIKKFNSYLFLP